MHNFSYTFPPSRFSPGGKGTATRKLFPTYKVLIKALNIINCSIPDNFLCTRSPPFPTRVRCRTDPRLTGHVRRYTAYRMTCTAKQMRHDGASDGNLFGYFCYLGTWRLAWR